MLVLVVAYGTVGKVVAPKDYKHINDVFQAVGLHVVVNRTDFEDFKLALDVVVNGEVDKVVAPEHKNEVESILIYNYIYKNKIIYIYIYIYIIYIYIYI